MAAFRVCYDIPSHSHDDDAQDTTWSLYVGRDFSVSSLASVQAIPLPYSESDNVVRTFSATCSLLQIAREILEVVYVPVLLYPARLAP